MITKIWLKNQPKKEIDYPDCYPSVIHSELTSAVFIINSRIKTHTGPRVDSQHALDSIARMEFRPS